MSSNYVDCPDGGKCGHYRHRLRSNAYQWCMKKAITRGSNSGQVNSSAVTKPPERRSHVMKSVDQIMMALRKGKSRYFELPRYFVTDDMVIQEDMVQAYINNPDEINELCREEWEGYIRDDIEGYSEEIFNKLGIDIDDFDSEEIEYVLDAVLEADRSDIAGAMAKNMKPRIFSLSSVDDGEEKRGAFYFANQSGDAGSDEWFDELGSRYHKCAREHGLIDRDYDALGHNWENQRTDLKESVTSLLKNAISERGGEVNSADDLPDLYVVWKGSLHDIAPAYEDENFFTIESAYLVASYKDVGVVGEPVLVRGYRTPFAGKAEREWGAYSGIQDEATSDKAIFSPVKIDALDLRESKVSMGDYLAPRE